MAVFDLICITDLRDSVCKWYVYERCRWNILWFITYGMGNTGDRITSNNRISVAPLTKPFEDAVSCGRSSCSLLDATSRLEERRRPDWHFKSAETHTRDEDKSGNRRSGATKKNT